jgi:hypothetical protein
MLASKFFDDVYYNNAYYARVGGISNVEVTQPPPRLSAAPVHAAAVRVVAAATRWLGRSACGGTRLGTGWESGGYHQQVNATPPPQVNSLEMEMLRMISFSLFVQTDQYDRYRASLYSHVGQPGQPASHAPGPGTINPAAAQAVEAMTD